MLSNAKQCLNSRLITRAGISGNNRDGEILETPLNFIVFLYPCQLNK